MKIIWHKQRWKNEAQWQHFGLHLRFFGRQIFGFSVGSGLEITVENGGNVGFVVGYIVGDIVGRKVGDIDFGTVVGERVGISVCIGVGSIVEAGTTSLYIQLGANFIVSPVLISRYTTIC